MTERRLIRLPGEPEEAAVDVTEGSDAEFAELGKVKVTDPKLGGVEYDAWAKRQAEWIERNFDSPGTMIDEPVPVDFWKAVGAEITRDIKSTNSIGLRVIRDTARRWAQQLYKDKHDAYTPQRAQMDLRDMYLFGCKDRREMLWLAELMRCFREACYIVFQREYLNRRVG